MAVHVSQHQASTLADLRYEPTPLRVRAMVGGEAVVDSRQALLVWEPRRIVPMYAVPEADLRFGAEPSEMPPEPVGSAPVLGPSMFLKHTAAGDVVDVKTADGGLAGAGFRFHDPDLGGAVLLDFSAFDEWLVEDEPRVGHPHDPFKRISLHSCSTEVEVSHDGIVLASSSRTQLLLETHLPPRFYFPPDDVRLDLLEPSSHRTTCAYKGHASYVSLPGVADDIAWRYEHPLDEVARIRDHYCFWSERTDLRLNGEPQPRPISYFSRPESS